MIKIAVCDDEKYFINEITEILENYLEKSGITYDIDSFNSGEKFIELKESTDIM